MTTRENRTHEKTLKAIAKRSFCTLATSSPAQRPHVAGVLYQAVGTTLYVSTERGSRKARNIAANPHVAVCIPIRRLPVGTPSSVQFQGRAEILPVDHPELVRLAGAGRLKAVTSHGELELPDGCFLRITPMRRLTTYGVGMSLVRLLRDPLNAAGTVELAA
ncbi:pyridoxamine 5'-phosphate oxidase family protein [Prauserella muralis]|nr:pyridoxamine 5'-phosphate oxidase family protein [Prauserella muralis]